MVEPVIGLYKPELIRRRGLLRNLEMVEFTTLEWVDWFNNCCRFEPIGNISPSDLEEIYYCALENPTTLVERKQTRL